MILADPITRVLLLAIRRDQVPECYGTGKEEGGLMVS